MIVETGLGRIHFRAGKNKINVSQSGLMRENV